MKKVETFVDDAAKDVSKAITDGLSLGPEFDAIIPISISPPGLQDSPFGEGKAKKIYPATGDEDEKGDDDKKDLTGDVSIWCVDCGVTGTLHLSGQARYSIPERKLTQAKAGLEGNIDTTVKLGIDANVKYERDLGYPIFSAGAPGFSVPGIFTIGPILTLDAEVDIDIEAKGKAVAGVVVSTPDLKANIDLVDGSKSSCTGLTPELTPYYSVEAALEASAALSLPLGVGLGIEITPLGFEKTAALYDKPSIEATIGATTSAGSAGAAEGGENACNDGVSFNVAGRFTQYSLNQITC